MAQRGDQADEPLNSSTITGSDAEITAEAADYVAAQRLAGQPLGEDSHALGELGREMFELVR